MLYHEFKEWLEENASAYPIYMEKVTEFQLMKNKGRAGKAKWKDRKVDRAIQGMWESVVANAYELIKAQKGVPKYNGRQVWLDFMEEKNFLEGFNEGASEVEFE
ncbi:hypothetical protein P7E02_20070 [Enterococcus hulanensis]|uniref:hypothetical protein n=1 Tax=Enterococcus hulanensis TaxID=2559929 RepID=UPI0028902938|nr:hypothetical protein [Enterococcus hulanensis]MDT2662188.1 hypothetical protein [Enterococcus hulanensis]